MRLRLLTFAAQRQHARHYRTRCVCVSQDVQALQNNLQNLRMAQQRFTSAKTAISELSDVDEGACNAVGCLRSNRLHAANCLKYDASVQH